MAGGGDELQLARRIDAAVLHFLLDVRLPAHRRFRVGGGRHARARIPHRRDFGAHDLERRRAATRRRPQPDSGAVNPQLPLLRPDLRLRVGGDFARRNAPHLRKSGGRVLLHHGDERKLRPPGAAGGRGGRHFARAVSLASIRSQKAQSARATSRQRRDFARGRRRRRDARGRFRRRRRCLERDEF